MKKYLVMLVALVLIGCGNPYQTARSTILIGRGVIVMSQTAFDTYVLVETQKCQEQCKTDPVCMTKCLEPVMKATPVYQKIKLAAIAGCDEADALVNVAERLKQKEPVDWLVPLRTSACLIARSLDFCSVETKKKIQGLIDLMGKFGCTK